jgi:hypothetical protein
MVEEKLARAASRGGGWHKTGKRGEGGQPAVPEQDTGRLGGCDSSWIPAPSGLCTSHTDQGGSGSSTDCR